MNLNRRLKALEQQVSSGEIVLYMPGGGVEVLRGVDRAAALLRDVFRGQRTPEVELVAQSISSTEPDGAHLVDLERAILNSPVEEAR